MKPSSIAAGLPDWFALALPLQGTVLTGMEMKVTAAE